MTRRLRLAAARLMTAAVTTGVLCACAADAPGRATTSSGPGRSTVAAPRPSTPGTVQPSITGAVTHSPTTEPDTFTVVAGGDVLLHGPTWEQADADAGAVGDGVLDFGPMLADIAPVVTAADLALCHLETPLAAPGGPFAGYPAFSVPPAIVPALRATGFDACSTASNHTFDQGMAGVERTVAQLAAGGLPGYGTGVGGAPPNPTLVTAGGVRVGLLSYTYGSNAAVPQDGVAELLDPADIAADARQARTAGAEIVIASLHWGTEYDHEPNSQQQQLAPVLAASADLDLMIGHHAHVVQPMRQVDGTWVAFGLGNMIATQATDVPANHEGVLARFTFSRAGGRWQVTEAAYVPTFVDRDPAVRLVVLGRPGDTSARHAEALARTREVVRDGAASAGLVEVVPD